MFLKYFPIISNNLFSIVSILGLLMMLLINCPTSALCSFVRSMHNTDHISVDHHHHSHHILPSGHSLRPPDGHFTAKPSRETLPSSIGSKSSQLLSPSHVTSFSVPSLFSSFAPSLITTTLSTIKTITTTTTPPLATKITNIDSISDEVHPKVAKSLSIHHYHSHHQSHKMISLLPVKLNWHRSSLSNFSSPSFSLPSSSSSSSSSSSTSSIKVKRAEPEHVSRSSCSDDDGCSATQTKCLRRIGLCGCPRGYVTVDLTAKHRFQEARETLESNQSKYCYKLKRVSESCEYDVQCFVSNSWCDKSSHSSSSSYSDRTAGTCLCSPGYSQQAGTEAQEVFGHTITSDRICHSNGSGSSTASTLSSITRILVALFIVTVIVSIGIAFKMHRSRQLALQQQTMVTTSVNGPPNQPGDQRSPYTRDLGNLPPMGSAEAEFQNDFIQVFPMHHLEPCPEKNMSALMQ
ncbi:uncharacterized protein LOC141853578 [Brevipalpus obovatus]|uniref:uncharacterized protein LOC141853578 n=1 Tax=Brevipalpus obovatus TaxID=246614 RepID=UPI003D9E8E32